MCACIVVMKEDRKKTMAGNVFSQLGTEIMRTYPIRKDLWNIINF